MRGLYVLTPNDYDSTGGIIKSAKLTPTGKGRMYFYNVAYSYQVDNRNYVSDRIFYSGTRGDSEVMKSYAKKYPVGARVKVYYEKGNPSYAVLDPLNRRGYPLQMAAVITFLSLMSLGIGLHMKKKQEAMRIEALRRRRA
jgi:hypothetical protein